MNNKINTVYLCSSTDFKSKGETKIALDVFYDLEHEGDESPLEFCKRLGWENAVYEMLVVDFLILNRDRHGANIEVLRNKNTKTLRLAPLFDHGLSLLCRCRSDEEFAAYDIMEDKPVQSYVGSRSTKENLSLIPDDKMPVLEPLDKSHRDFLLSGLTDTLPAAALDKIWDMIWVRQRIIPSDRQNLGQILKDNGLTEYDEYNMLMLTMGRCPQDDYYLVPTDEFSFSKEITTRFFVKIEDIVPLEDFNLLVFFRNGKVKKCNLKNHFRQYRNFNVLLKDPDLFNRVRIQVGGYSVTWDESLNISDLVLYETGRPIPLSASDFASFAAHRIINRAEAAELLDCSRQNIDDLTKRGKLHPIKSTAKNTLYLKSEIMKRSWL